MEVADFSVDAPDSYQKRDAQSHSSHDLFMFFSTIAGEGLVVKPHLKASDIYSLASVCHLNFAFLE